MRAFAPAPPATRLSLKASAPDGPVKPPQTVVALTVAHGKTRERKSPTRPKTSKWVEDVGSQAALTMKSGLRCT